MTSSDRKQGHARASLAPLRSFPNNLILSFMSSSRLLQSSHSSKLCSDSSSTASTLRALNLFALSTNSCRRRRTCPIRGHSSVCRCQKLREAHSHLQNPLAVSDTVYEQKSRDWLEYQPAYLNTLALAVVKYLSAYRFQVDGGPIVFYLREVNYCLNVWECRFDTSFYLI